MRRTLPAVATAAAAFMLAGCQSTTTVNTTPANTTAAGTAPTPAKGAPATSRPAPKKAGIGSAIDLKGDGGDSIQVTLVKIVDPAKSANEYITPDAGKRYVAVQLRIVNKGTAVYSDDPQVETKVKDALGESFDVDFADTTAGTSMDSGLNLAPGDTALGFVTFQVPTGQKVTQVQYSVSLFGGSVAQWTVG